MDERRSELRTQVSFPARMWLGDGVFAEARAVDASPGGMRLLVSARALGLIHRHESYFVEVDLADSPVACVAEVRHCDGGIGLMLKERVPELAETHAGLALEAQTA
jgi:hypothetical protein